MAWWDGRPVCAGAEARPWRALRSAEASRSAFVRNACAKRHVYALHGAWSPAECDALVTAADAAAAAAGGWSRTRHATYPTRDVPADALPPAVNAALRHAVRDRVLRPVAARAGFDRTDDLVVRDLFIINYEAAEGGQAALELHRDASLLSFNVLLSRPSDFGGGGTVFPHLDCSEGDGEGAAAACDVADARGVVRLAQGDVCVHSGGVLHGGCAVTRGRRVVLVGFVDSARDNAPQHAAETRAPAE